MMEKDRTDWDAVYRRFCGTKQPALRLAAAVDGFFGGQEVCEEARAEYGHCIRSRIRPAVELLIEQNEPGRILELERLGWFGERELDEFIRRAGERGRETVLLVLLRLKEERYGYRDRDYSL